MHLLVRKLNEPQRLEVPLNDYGTLSPRQPIMRSKPILGEGFITPDNVQKKSYFQSKLPSLEVTENT